jgi:hemolysin activation/secretion protein
MMTTAKKFEEKRTTSPLYCTAGLLLAGFATPVLALDLDLTNPADHNLQNQQQQRMLDDARQQREELSGRDAAAIEKPKSARTPAANANFANQSCVKVSRLSFRGMDTVPQALKQRLIADYPDHCLQQADFDRLLDEVNDWYVAKGYVTSHAWIPHQDFANDVLIVEAVEGKLGRVYFGGADDRGDRGARMAFPGSHGDVVNLRDIEQGVEQIERVAPDGVKVAIRPAEEPGYSDLVLTGDAARGVAVNLAVDNNGAENTGRNEAIGALTSNNLLGFGEQISVSGDATVPDHPDRYRHDYSVSASVPLGYWTFSYAGSGGNYAIPLSIFDTDLSYHGRSNQQRVTASRTVSRTARSKTDVFASLSHYTSGVYLSDLELTQSGQRQTAAQIGVNFATRVSTDSYLTLSPSFTQGLPMGSTDMSDEDGPNARFRKLAFGASFYKAISARVGYLTSAYGQWTPDALYGSERLTVGSDSSVRGFRDRYLYGNTGAYWRNELQWRVPAPSWAGRVTMSASLDAGRIVPVEGEPASGGTIVGAALAASTSFKNFSASLSVGKPLCYPEQLNPDPIVVTIRLATAF